MTSSFQHDKEYMEGLTLTSLKYTVLVVEDEPIYQRIIASTLTGEYKLVLAKDGERVMELCLAHLPDLILLDVVLPGISGYDIAVRLKNSDRTKAIPIIFLTGKSDEDDINRAFEVGGVDFIAKPFKSLELLARVKSQITLRLAEKRLREAIDHVPHPFYAKDVEGRIIVANTEAALFFNTSVEEMVGKHTPSLPEGWRTEKTTPVGSSKEMRKFEEQITTPDGKKLFFLSREVPFSYSNSELPAVLHISIDITEEKEREEKIIALNSELQKNTQYKDKFLSLIAHDLVTPVFNTDMTLKLLLNRIDSLSRDDILHRLERVKSNTSNTLKLLTNLLEWSKAQFKAFSFNPIELDLNEEVGNILSYFESPFKVKNLKTDVQIPTAVKIVADREMFRTILRNLLSNAIKFSTVDATIGLVSKNHRGSVFISIVDHGVGMNYDTLLALREGNNEHLTSFGTAGEKGSGIGMNLVKEFIEAHGGTLQIDREVGKGSNFTFSIPQESENA